MEPPSFTQPDDEPASDELETEAITWLVRLTSGETGTADHTAFENWRAESPAHEEALLRARRLWVGLGQVLPEAPKVVPQRRSWQPVLVTAASLALGAILAFQYLHDWRHDFVTPTGQRESFTLADGTQVQLSSGSALDVRFADRARRVELVRGEAFFDVVHDARRPFSVVAGEGSVTDIGTAFSVRLDDADKVRVVVARGSVRVTAPDGEATLIHDQRTAYADHGVEPVVAADVMTDLAWTRGRLILEDRPLTAVVAEINRYTPQRVELLNSAAAGRHVNAVIDLDHVDDWLNALRQSQNVRIARLPGFVLLY